MGSNLTHFGAKPTIPGVESARHIHYFVILLRLQAPPDGMTSLLSLGSDDVRPGEFPSVDASSLLCLRDVPDVVVFSIENLCDLIISDLFVSVLLFCDLLVCDLLISNLFVSVLFTSDLFVADVTLLSVPFDSNTFVFVLLVSDLFGSNLHVFNLLVSGLFFFDTFASNILNSLTEFLPDSTRSLRQCICVQTMC